jgi:hypothetical protein
MMLRQRRQNQRQARALRVVLEDAAVNSAEKALGVDLYLRLFPAAAMVHRRAPCTHAAVGGHGLVRLGQFLSQRRGNRARHTLGQFDLVQSVAVALKELDLMLAEPEHLVAVGRLQYLQQRFGVKAIGHDHQFGDWPLKSVDSKEPLCAQHGQPVKSVTPKVAVVHQAPERLQERLDLWRRVTPQQRCLQLLDEVPEPDRILLVVWMVAMGRLVEREAGGITASQKLRHRVASK